MHSRGYVTIFVSLVLVVMMMVALAVMKITDRSSAKVKAVAATGSVMSSEMAHYNRLIFDRYHILLFDSNASGRGEGAIEEDIRSLLMEDLGEDYSIDSVELSGTKGILDNDLEEFKKQINENFKYEVIEYAADRILEKTQERDSPIDDEEIEEIDSDISSDVARIESEEAAKSTEEAEEDDKGSEEVTDPRDTLKTYVNAGIEILVLPTDKKLSSHQVDKSELPSKNRPSKLFEGMGTDFDDLSRMKTDSKKNNGWASSLITYTEACAYATSHFNCLTDQKYDDTYLNLEMEYLIGGQVNDGKNYKRVVDEILIIRFGMNLLYILNDSTKMAECEELATAITFEFPPAQPVVKYLLAGCWAYIESVADIYLLLRDHSVPFIKSSDTWTTDFDSLSNLEKLVSEPSDEETGLTYKEYLIILMALQGDDLYYRMLDLMQMNVTNPEYENHDETFRMSNAVTAFAVNTDISYKSYDFNIHEETGY